MIQFEIIFIFQVLRKYWLKKYFEQFGEVESSNFSVGLPATLRYILIQYKDARAVNKLLNQGRVRVSFIEFEVKPLRNIRKSVREPDANTDLTKAMETLTLGTKSVKSSRTQAENSPDNILNALNDDCLRAIFGKINRLADIVSISHVCKRFKQIGEDVFPWTIRRSRVRLNSLSPKGARVTSLQIENFLRAWGSSVLSLEVKKMSGSNTLLKLMNNNCPNLTHLRIINVNDIRESTVTKIQPLLAKLKQLEIDLSEVREFPPFYELISTCTQLETLEINNSSALPLPMMTFANLINFKMNASYRMIGEFLLLNPQLQSLDVAYSQGLGQFIESNLLSLQKINLSTYSDEMSENDSFHFRNLKHLQIHLFTDFTNSITNIFGMKNITTLSLFVNDLFDENLMSELTRNLCNLNGLTLSLSQHRHPQNHITTHFLKKIIQNVHQLKRLQIHMVYDVLYHFDERDYYEVLNIVKGRAICVKLHILLTYSTLICRDVKKFKHIRFNAVPEWLAVEKHLTY